MSTVTSTPGSNHGLVVLELCSYGDSGDFQVLPRKALDMALNVIQERIAASGGKAVLSDGVLLAETGGTHISLYSDGRAVLEHVAPCSRQAALELYMFFLGHGPG